MTTKRYELSDEQWAQIAPYFSKYRTGRPPKSNRAMISTRSYGLHEAGLPGVICRKNMVHGKPFTAVFVFGVIMDCWNPCLFSLISKPIMKTQALIPLSSLLINTV